MLVLECEAQNYMSFICEKTYLMAIIFMHSLELHTNGNIMTTRHIDRRKVFLFELIVMRYYQN